MTTLNADALARVAGGLAGDLNPCPIWPPFIVCDRMPQG